MGILEAAIEYTKRGWTVHPLSKPDDKRKSPGKKPIITEWQFLTKTPDDLGRYLKDGCNLGLVCGKASNIDAIDFDLDLFHDELFDGLEIKTLESGHTAGRGHLLFQHDETIFSEKHHFIGIEFFGNNAEGAGSNLVLPPSKHFSGDIYQWKNPDINPIKIPDKLKSNMQSLFKKEDALHDYFKKCRHCFTKGSKKYDKEDPRSKGIWGRPDDIAVHGMDGRAAIIAIMGELKNVGCPDDLLHMACKRFFGKDYRYNETAEALKYIKAIPPKCETLRTQLNVECDGCAWKQSNQYQSVDIPSHTPKPTQCSDCVYGTKKAGSCKNPEVIDETTKNKQKKIVYDSPSCNKFKVTPIKEPKSRKKPIEKSDELDENDPMYTDMRNSKRLVKIVGENARYCSSWKSWMIFNGKYWEMDKSGRMLRWARQVVIELQKEAILIEDTNKKKTALSNALKCEALPRLKSMVELCQSEFGMSIDENEFDKNKILFNVQNGTLDLTTGKIRTHSPSDFITKISPVVYNPEAKCTRFMDFLEEALLFGDEEMEMITRIAHRTNLISYLQRFSGYCLTGNVKEEQFCILYGDGGHGKSKYTGAIAYVLGDYHGKVDIATIQESVRGKDGSSPTPDLVKLKGLRLVTASEPEKGLKLNESRIKDFTGRDPIKCRGLHESPITFMPEFKLCIYTNYPIIIRGQDKSIWRRIHQIGFDNEPKVIDKDLDLKLQAEASGILNWMLAGCMEWNKTGLSVPTEITDAVEEYKKDMDVLSDFFDLCCVCNKKDNSIKGLAKDLFHVYQAWWKIDNFTNAPYFDKQFYGALHERGYKRVEKHSRNGLLIKGVTLASPVKKAYDDAVTICGGYNCDAVTIVTHFLVNFIAISHVEKKPDICITSVTPSQKEYIDNDHKKNIEAETLFRPLSQKEKVNAASQLIISHYGTSQLISQAGIEVEADNLKFQINSTKEDALFYIMEAVKNRSIIGKEKFCDVCGNPLNGSETSNKDNHIICERRRNNVMAYLEEFEPQVQNGVGVDEYLLRGAGFKWDHASDAEIKHILDTMIHKGELAVVREKPGQRFLIRNRDGNNIVNRIK